MSRSCWIPGRKSGAEPSSARLLPLGSQDPDSHQVRLEGQSMPCQGSLLDEGQQNSLCSLLGVNEYFEKLEKWEEVLLRETFHWLRFKVLRILHLHGEAFQEVAPVTSPRTTWHSLGRRLELGSLDQAEKRKPC